MPRRAAASSGNATTPRRISGKTPGRANAKTPRLAKQPRRAREKAPRREPTPPSKSPTPSSSSSSSASPSPPPARQPRQPVHENAASLEDRADARPAVAPPVAPAPGPGPLRHCCLRCSKRYALDPGLRCTRPAPEQRCTYCSNLKQVCEKVPRRRYGDLRRVQVLARTVCDLRARLASDPSVRRRLSKAKKSLVRAQRFYKTRVEDSARLDKEHVKPRVGLPRLFNVLEDIAAGIKENNRLLRYVAGLPQAPKRSPTPSNSGDEADGADDVNDEGSSIGLLCSSSSRYLVREHGC
ncbi:hypothetical protein GP486_000512 [Trichoglossum hirsutum]|uniref:Uncharacterized protein n=1 Tax=Trichoglossum hirsutum TaxID=265104 RepID=A0A9P8LIR6_9PEZI|nr:hypothetical protein GP486_000512 [Trichoglossum hirsutum]